MRPSDHSTRSGQSPSELLGPLRDFLLAPRQAVLAVLGSDGAPRQVVLNYLLDDDHILLNGRSERHWVRNARRDRRASIVIHDAEHYLHWVGFRGFVELGSEGSQALEEAMRMASYYGEDPRQHQGQTRVGFRFVPFSRFEGPG